MTFKGFNEHQREKLRSVAVGHRELKEPGEDEEEEE